MIVLLCVGLVLSIALNVFLLYKHTEHAQRIEYLEEQL